MTSEQYKILTDLYNELDEKDYKEKQFLGELLVKLGVAYYTHNFEYLPNTQTFNWKQTLKFGFIGDMTAEEKETEKHYEWFRKEQHEREVSSEYHAIFDEQDGGY